MTGFNDRIAALADRVDKIKSGKYRLSQVGIVEKEAVPLLREMAQALSEAQAENVGLKGQFLDHAETDSYLRMVKYAAHVKDLYRWEKEQKEAAQAEYEGLRARQAKLKETLLPVCEYGAEIYNRGTPAIPMPDDTIQRLNWAFKMFGG